MNSILEIFRNKKVLTADQLMELLNCSIRTVQRKLKNWRTYRSYNQNGRFYVLPEIPKFDHNGLWKYKNIFFSKYGNLKNTVINLVKQSEAGLSALEIGELIALLPRSFMSHFRDSPGICRQKHQGRYIYFAKEEEIRTKQLQKRLDEKIMIERTSIKLLSDADAILILVQFIKYTNIDINELSEKIAREGKRIDPLVIKNFLAYHDLLKKTPDMK